jgi:hypothetical protein
MALPQTEIRFTVEEHLSRERLLTRSAMNFSMAWIFAMAGESPKHEHHLA